MKLNGHCLELHVFLQDAINQIDPNAHPLEMLSIPIKPEWRQLVLQDKGMCRRWISCVFRFIEGKAVLCFREI